MRRITVFFMVMVMLSAAVCLHPQGAEDPSPGSETESSVLAEEPSAEAVSEEGAPEKETGPEEETLRETGSEEETALSEPDTEESALPETEESTASGTSGQETEESPESASSKDETEPAAEETEPSEEETEPATAEKETEGETGTADPEGETSETEEEPAGKGLRAAASSCTIVIHSNGGTWYNPVNGEPAGVLGAPAGSGTNRTFSRTITSDETIVLHNTDATLPDDYYLVGGTVEPTTRWITWFTRPGYVFHGWNTKAQVNSAPTSHYSGWNVLDGGKMYTANNGPTTSPGNNFGQTVNLTMANLGASNGDTIHLYAQWRKRYGVTSSMDLSGGSGIRVSLEGFANGSSLYDGLELMIPMYQKNVTNKIQTGGCSDFVWKTDTGKGRFYLQKALSKNTAYTTTQTLWVLLKDRAYDIYGQTYDVKITLSNIKITSTVNVDAGSANIFGVNMKSGMVECSVYPNKTGASYTVKVQILKSGTSTEVKGKRTMMLLRDLDIPDRLVGGANYQYRWNNGASTPGEEVPSNGKVTAIYPYAEAVSIPASSVAQAATRAASKQIYVQSDNSVVVAPTSSAVRVTGSEYTGGQSSSYGQVLQRDTYKAAVAFPAITGNLTINWTGNACGTALFEDGEMYHITSNVVQDNGTTLVNGGEGSATEGGTITLGGAGARAYPFNGSAAYTLKAAPGYRVSNVWLDRGTGQAKKLTVDGKEHTISGTGTYRISESGGTFTFVGILADHDIRVSYGKDELKTGSISVEKVVKGNMGSRDAAFRITVRLSHTQGYDTYPGGKIACRLNGGAEQYLTLTAVSGTAGAATVTFELTHGDKMVLSGLWENTSYTVTEAEANQNGYVTTMTNAAGTIRADQTAAVTVTNTRDAPVPTGVRLPAAVPALAAGLAGSAFWLIRRRRNLQR